jgi:hypothetical protein
MVRRCGRRRLCFSGAGVDRFGGGVVYGSGWVRLGVMSATEAASERGVFIQYDESPEDRKAREDRELIKARQSFRITPGQRKTLRKARRSA